MLGEVLVASPRGYQVPLSELARIEHVRGPAMIASENGLLLATVLLNVQGRDVGSFVEEARARVAKEVSLHAGCYIGCSRVCMTPSCSRLVMALRRCDVPSSAACFWSALN